MPDITPTQKGIPALEALSFVGDIFFTIAIPTTLFAFLGRFIDTRLHSSPYFTIIGLFLSCILVWFLIIKKAKKIALRLRSKL